MPFYLDPMLWLFGLALLLAALARLRRQAASGAVVLAVAMVCLGSPALSNVWLTSLERQQPLRACKAADSPVVVVLGGGVDLRYPGLQPAERLSDASWRRALAAVPLLGGDSVLIFSGGGRATGRNPETEANAMAALVAPALPDGVSVITENRSRNTFDNAHLSAELLRAEGLPLEITLVTSAAHMPRASRVFAKVGFDLCAHAVDPVAQPAIPWHAWLPQTSAYLKTYVAAREWMGLAAYRLQGRL